VFAPERSPSEKFNFSKGTSAHASYEVSPVDNYGYEISSSNNTRNLKQYEIEYDDRAEAAKRCGDVNVIRNKNKTKGGQQEGTNLTLPQPQTYEVWDEKSQQFVPVNKEEGAPTGPQCVHPKKGTRIPKSLIRNKWDDKFKMFAFDRDFAAEHQHQHQNKQKESDYEVWNSETKMFDRVLHSKQDPYTDALIYEECNDVTQNSEHRI